MKLNRILLIFFIFIIPLVTEAFTVRNVVLNGSFEEGIAEDGERPLWWYIGFPDDPPITSLGDWLLDSSVVGAGEVSLHVITHCADTESYFLVQFIDAPTYDLEGKTVSLSLKLKHGGSGGGVAFLFAYNPEATDSMIGLIPVVGYTILSSNPADTGFTVYSDSFVATGPAEIMALMLLVEGWAEEVWLDDIQVVFDAAEPGAGPDTSEVPDMLGGAPRDFYLGVVAELPRNQTEAAYYALPYEIAEVGDIMNVFAHIKWNALRGEPLTSGHEEQLQFAESGRELGLERMITFDFTHNNAETVGEINPWPDGTPVDSLSPEVRAAYIDELLALVDEMDPIIVSVGVETSIFHRERPEQWGNYVRLMEEATEALSIYPDIHVTAYFVLTMMVDVWGNIDPDLRAAWEEIMPYCESVAYSYYSIFGGMGVIPENYFIIPKDIAPDKPLLIPEFGSRSDAIAGYDEELQYEVTQAVISQVASTEPQPVAICWYQMYDLQYLDAPVWFRVFSSVGLKHYDGTPKMVHAGFRKMLSRGTGIDEVRTNIPRISIHAYPNPFNSICKISVVSSGLMVADLEIYDINGRMILRSPLGREVACKVSTAGKNEVINSQGIPPLVRGVRGDLLWQPAPSIPSGMYFVRVQIGDRVISKKVLYLK